MLASKTSKRKRRETVSSTLVNSSPPVSYLPNRIFEQKHKFSVTLSVQRKLAKIWLFGHVEPLWLARDFVVVVQLLSHVHLFAIPWSAACQVSLSFTISRSLLRLMSIEWCYLTISSSAIPLLLSSIFLIIRVFFNESALHIRWLHISIGASASASVLPMNIQGWFSLGLTGLILQSKGL